MKSRFVKITLTLVLCIAMLSSNLAFAEESVSGDVIEQQEVDEIGLLKEENNTENDEEKTDIVTTGSSESKEIPNTESNEDSELNEKEPKLEELGDNENSVSDNNTGENSVSENSVSENSVSENSVSGNSVSENSIANLKKTEDGTSYILNKIIEKRNIIISLFIPISLFPEAKEIYFDAIEAKEEVKESFEETVNEEMQNEKLINDTELFDITLFVNNQKVTKFDENIIVTFEGDEIPVTNSNETVEVFHFDEGKEVVENLSDQVTISDEKIELETNHFSLYGYVMVVPRNYNTRDGVLNALGQSRFFSVFANELSEGDSKQNNIKGNIAVNKLKVANTNITMTSQEIADLSRNFTLIIKKIVDKESVTDRTFYFSVYDNNNHTGEPVLETSIVVAKNQKEASTTELKLDNNGLFNGNQIYYIFETDERGNINGDGKTCSPNGSNYEVTFASNINNDNVVSGIGTASYINQIDGISDSSLFSDALTDNKVVFGEGLKFISENNSTKIQEDYNSATLNTSNASYYIANKKAACINGEVQNIKYGDFPIKFDDVLSSLKDVSAGLAKDGGTESTEIKVECPDVNIKSRSWSSDIGEINSNEFSCVSDDKLLIINVDCTYWNGYDPYEIIDWKSCCSNWTLGDHVNYSNVIWNFYESYEEFDWDIYEYVTNYRAYDGEININENACGTIFAPAATVYLNGGQLDGSIIADKVIQKNSTVREILLSEKNDSKVVDVVCNNVDKYVPELEPLDIQTSKIATTDDEDARIYNLTLSANANVSSYQEQSVNDIILVLDCSESMNHEGKFDDLKSAVNDFLINLNDRNRISIITFNKDAKCIIPSPFDSLVPIEDVRDLLTSEDGIINKLGYNLYTRMDRGLDKASDVIEDSSFSNPTSIILFTDGEPRDDSNKTLNELEDLVEESTAYFDDNNIPIYTIGLRLNNITGPWLASEVASSPQYAFETRNSSDLTNLFNQLGDTITNADKDVIITDYIDGRFDLVKENGDVISYEDISNLSGKPYGADITVANTGDVNDKRIKLTWTKKLSDLDRKTHPEGWKKTIKIQAKNDFIGGNDIPTNGEESGVRVDGEDIRFPLQNVDVKVRFDADEAESTMFWGEKLKGNSETIDGTKMEFDYLTDSVLQNLLYKPNHNNVTWTDTNNTPIDLYDYNDKRRISPVLYKGDDQEPRFITSWYDSDDNLLLEDVLKNIINPGELYVEFKYKDTDSVAYGKYTIKIKKGSIKICKEIDSGARNQIEGDPIFTFKISEISADSNYNAGKVYYKTLRFCDIKNNHYSIIEGLPKGIYKVEELDTMGFKTSSITVNDETNCYSQESNIFYIGYKRKGDDKDKGYYNCNNADFGSVTFKNTKNRNTGKLTYTDVVKNPFEFTEDGFKMSNPIDNADNETE